MKTVCIVQRTYASVRARSFIQVTGTNETQIRRRHPYVASTRSSSPPCNAERRAPSSGSYAEFGGTVFGYLVKTLGDRGVAEDVHQQVFLEVWKRSPSYDPERAGLLTWIMQIARSRAIDQMRKRIPDPVDIDEQAPTDSTTSRRIH